MARLELTNVVKRYGRTEAVRRISFDVEDGELLVILGPSGCGKTSTLRMIAGLESVTSGDIRFDGRRVNDVPPARRNVAMAFENYGLYEHWTVFDNIAYPLRLRGTEPASVDRVVRDVAAKLQIESALVERPTSLSGGVRQRVGLARALVRDPSLFLLDEPMSHVDADLRNDMRAEIKRIHVETGSTMIIVTHDQLDALAMADRILVMDHGRIEQHATPDEVYQHPQTAFVAGFIGEPPMNMIRAASGADGALVLPGGERLRSLGGPGGSVGSSGETGSLVLAFRPHVVVLHRQSPVDVPADAVQLAGKVYMVEPLGDRALVTVEGPDGLLKVDAVHGSLPARGDRVWLVVARDDLQLFELESGRLLGADVSAVAGRAS